MILEDFNHDVCKDCGTESVPAEGVKDQSLRCCPKCGRDWFENLNAPVLTNEDWKIARFHGGSLPEPFNY